jgi:hypothetical protein
MCFDCWTGFGSPVEFTPTTEATAALVSRLYELSVYGGNLHCIVDDWNIDDDDLARCRRNIVEIQNGGGNEALGDCIDAEQVAIEAAILDAMDGMTLAERATVLAIDEGIIAIDSQKAE